jgi:hypothetical protein
VKERRRFRLAVIAIVLWSSSGAPAEAGSPIHIGASESRTGTYAAPGQNQLRGYELCVRHTNERGGLLGRKLELVVEDDHSDAAGSSSPTGPWATTRFCGRGPKTLEGQRS